MKRELWNMKKKKINWLTSKMNVIMMVQKFDLMDKFLYVFNLLRKGILKNAWVYFLNGFELQRWWAIQKFEHNRLSPDLNIFIKNSSSLYVFHVLGDKSMMFSLLWYIYFLMFYSLSNINIASLDMITLIQCIVQIKYLTLLGSELLSIWSLLIKI